MLSCLLLLAALLPAAVRAQPLIANPGVRAVAHPKLFNLYWSAGWDADNPGFSSGTIDGLTAALMGTNFLAKAGQYGVLQGSFAGSAVPARSPLLGTLCGNPPGRLVDPAAIQSWLACEAGTPGTGVAGSDADTIYVVWLPKRTSVESRGDLFNSCAGPSISRFGTAFSAYVASLPTSVPYIVMPMSCVANNDQLTTNLSRQLVNAATDPGGLGWRNAAAGWTGAGPVDYSQLGQAGDICPTAAGAIRVGGLAVNGYWSNSDSVCVAGNALFTALAAAPKVLPPFTTTVLVGSTQPFTFPTGTAPLSWSASRPVGDAGFMEPSGVYHAPPWLWAPGTPQTQSNRFVTISVVDSLGHAGSASVCLRSQSGLTVSGPDPIYARQTRQLTWFDPDPFVGIQAPALVTWSVAGGPGSVDASGLYTAPNRVDHLHTQVVVQASSLDQCGPVSAQRPLTVEPPVLAVTPAATQSLSAGSAFAFRADPYDGSAQTWTVAPVPNPRDNPADTPGTVTPGPDPDQATYHAPASVLADHRVKLFVSAADGRTAQVFISVRSDLKLSPTAALLLAGQTKQFATNIAPPGGNCAGPGSTPIPCPAPRVTWTLSGSGTLDGKGLYTAPPSILQAEVVTVKASVPDGRTAYADVTLVADQTLRLGSERRARRR